MVADPFQVFCNHQKVKRILAVCRLTGNLAYQFRFYLVEIIVHDIVHLNDLLGQCRITLYIGVNAFGYHLDSRFRHSLQQRAVFGVSSV